MTDLVDKARAWDAAVEIPPRAAQDIRFAMETLHFGMSYAAEKGDDGGEFHRQAVEAHERLRRHIDQT